MYGQVAVLVLLCAVLSLGARWKQPTVIASVKEQLQFLAQATDPARNRTHFLYAKEEGDGQYALYFQTIDESTITQPLPIMKGYFQKVVSDIVIAGQSICLALNVYRTPGNTDDYLDVFFLESKDDGKTWSQPAAVPRDDMNDPRGRFNPQIVATDADSPRLCIAYFRAEFADEEGDICLVCRPPGSSIFNKESAIFKKKTLVSRVRLAYGALTAFHIVYIAVEDGVFRFYYHRSDDNGYTWSTTKLADLSRLEKFQEPAVVASRGLYPGTLVLAYVYCGSQDTRFFYTYDMGVKWDYSTISGSERYVITNMALCQNAVTVWSVFFSRSTEIIEKLVDNEGRYNNWLVKASSSREVENPFTFDYRVKTIYRPQFGCTYRLGIGGTLSASAIAINANGNFVILHNRATAEPA